MLRTFSRSSYSLKTPAAVIGGGLAGCSVALELADAGVEVDLFVKGKLRRDSNSHLIAGGLSAVPLKSRSNGDSSKLHVKETLEAGAGLNDLERVQFCVDHFYSDVIDWLIQKGVSFDRSAPGGPFDLHREGGHTANRIFHVQDKTGKAIMDVLTMHVLNHPKIHVHEESIAIDLVTKRKIRKLKGTDACVGAYFYNQKENRVLTVSAQSVFVATGGLGRVFLYTTNADVAAGDGFAMCYRAGLPLANMEFIQFHPSVFYDTTAHQEDERRFLLTEALRGAGAILKLDPHDRSDFVLKYHRLGSNATRDIVTRAEDAEMRRLGLKHVWLDCRPIGRKRLLKDFRNSYEYCKSKGMDITKEPIPVIYATHYSNGGVLVGAQSETSLRGCYVLGETSYTGLHGATRLASNSAPECVLYGRLAAQHFLENRDKLERITIPIWNSGRATAVRDKTAIVFYWDSVRRTMTNLCGISRNDERLVAARDMLASIRKAIREFYWTYHVTKDFLEVRNIAEVAQLIVDGALAREESRACHFREDFPKQNDLKFKKLTVLQKGKEVRFCGVASKP
jgi:L-aspartate oxidase